VSTSLGSLKKRLQEDITPLDVAAAILYYFGEVEFTTDYEKLNRAFYKERENEFLKEFRFLEGRSYPYSELLDSIISRLSISGLLGCQNPDYRKFFIRKEQIERIAAGSLRKFSEKQKQEIKSLSNKILQQLK
jgi:hypothetical protein